MVLPTRYISRVRLNNYRNFATAALDLDSRHIVLYGANGSGKTNLLEAISLFSLGRGLRGANLADLAKKDNYSNANDSWAVAITIESENGSIDMGTGSFAKDSGRRLRINGVNASSLQEMSSYIRILWLTPDMDNLFRGAAAHRRKFFDRLVTTLIPDHNITLNNYERAIRSRNKLLEENKDSAWLDAIEAQMAQYASAIYFSRLDYIYHLQDLIDNNINNPSFPSSVLSLSPLFADEHEPTSSTALELELIEFWKNSREIDKRAGRTLVGPHRVDFTIIHKQKSTKAALCSTGEQKALLIGLVLANARLVQKMTNIKPILLLDEIAAHLDRERRCALFDNLNELATQCFMSGTDKIFFHDLADRAQYYKIDAAQIIAD